MFSSVIKLLSLNEQVKKIHVQDESGFGYLRKKNLYGQQEKKLKFSPKKKKKKKKKLL
jgi:hypothetical protein